MTVKKVQQIVPFYTSCLKPKDSLLFPQSATEPNLRRGTIINSFMKHSLHNFATLNNRLNFQ